MIKIFAKKIHLAHLITIIFNLKFFLVKFSPTPIILIKIVKAVHFPFSLVRKGISKTQLIYWHVRHFQKLIPNFLKIIEFTGSGRMNSKSSKH